MDQIKVVFHEIVDENFKTGHSKQESAPDVQFVIKSGPLETNVIFSQWNVKSIHWQHLINCIQNKTKYQVKILNSNGWIGISTDNGIVTFSVSKYGGENYGRSDTTLPGEICLEAFGSAQKSLENYFTRNPQ